VGHCHDASSGRSSSDPHLTTELCNTDMAAAAPLIELMPLSSNGHPASHADPAGRGDAAPPSSSRNRVFGSGSTMMVVNDSCKLHRS
jgi:hypothetical protein